MLGIFCHTNVWGIVELGSGRSASKVRKPVILRSESYKRIFAVRPKRFSIVITFYNQHRFVRAAVESALSQPEHLREVIVVDDCSQDGTQNLLKDYADSVRLLCLPKNSGAVAARNHGASVATGEFLVFLDGDDTFMPWALEVYERLVAERSPTIILAPMLWFKGALPSLEEADEPRRIEFVEYSTLMLKDRPVGFSASSYVVARRAFLDVGGWTPEIFHLDCQDLSIKLGYSGRAILVSSPNIAFYRIHSANSILTVPPFVRMLHRLLRKERAGEYPGGREGRFERRVWFGGLVFFWIKRAFRAGLYWDALGLFASGWLMILTAIGRRAFIRFVKGQRPIETLEIAVSKRDLRQGVS
jgi:glycosyltransferase involved in cell wall biosynthesis